MLKYYKESYVDPYHGPNTLDIDSIAHMIHRIRGRGLAPELPIWSTILNSQDMDPYCNSGHGVSITWIPGPIPETALLSLMLMEARILTESLRGTSVHPMPMLPELFTA